MSNPYFEKMFFRAELTGYAAKAIKEKKEELKPKHGLVGLSRVTQIILSECYKLGLSDKITQVDDDVTDEKIVFNCTAEGDAALAIGVKIETVKSMFRIDRYGKKNATQMLLCEYYKLKHGK